MRSSYFNIFISTYFILLVGVVKPQGNVISRSAELDSLKSIRLKSPQRAVRYARQVLNELNPEQSALESKILNILGEIYVDLYLPSIALQYFIDAGHKSNVRKNPWNKINIGNVYFQQSLWLEAKERYLQALDMFRRLPAQKENAVVGRAVALSNLARIERNL